MILTDMKILTLTLSTLLAVSAMPVGAQINKCTINGTVTFQQGPCPSQEKRKTPTAAELNAAREKLPLDPQHRTGNWAKKGSGNVADATLAPSIGAPSAQAVAGFRCDGRKYCSQMTSCAEAKMFLANCPGVAMDGDRDGIPCEDQWCGH
jgi:hypothetical protein